MTKQEAIAAAAELRNSFNGGKPMDANDLIRGAISKDEHFITILAGSFEFQMREARPDVRSIRRIWDGFLEHRTNPVLEPWLRRYGADFIDYFRAL